ncbi:MAG TPA: ABC transporter ATP-binding protein [Chloroflexota bacterium]|nr:ABC transporter ATP-binding protein [Chloroflexota bacterium]
MTAPLLRLESVSKRYAVDGGWLPAVEDVTLDVGRGEFVSVIGPSGCGKSTLLNMVAGLIADYEGRAEINGGRVSGPHPAIGVVFQEESTFEWRTALRNVSFGLEMQGAARSEWEPRAQEMLRLVGLSDFANSHPSQLSGGMRQRVAIARALVLQPDLLLMDEPFGALDEQTRMLLGEELLRIQAELGQTILFVTHNIQEAVHLSDRVAVMSARPGRIKQVFDIGLPRPRSADIIASHQFGELIGEIWASLRSEAVTTARREHELSTT